MAYYFYKKNGDQWERIISATTIATAVAAVPNGATISFSTDSNQTLFGTYQLGNAETITYKDNSSRTVSIEIPRVEQENKSTPGTFTIDGPTAENGLLTINFSFKVAMVKYSGCYF